jgi:hypothetical protein
MEKQDWQSIGIGVFVGFILTLILMWYVNKDKKPYDWCFYLDSAKSSYCVDLYEQATKKMQERSDYEELQTSGALPDDGFR